jgi:hypothetical protein
MSKLAVWGWIFFGMMELCTEKIESSWRPIKAKAASDVIEQMVAPIATQNLSAQHFRHKQGANEETFEHNSVTF